MHNGPIVSKTFDFSINICKYCGFLETRRQYLISNQLLKCGTSIGANVFEAQSSESRNDFIHKMKIAQKEANETLYWLMLCNKIGELDNNQELLNKLNEIMIILSRIIVTGKQNLNKL